MSAEPRIFLSYSSWDRDFAVSQRQRIEAAGLSLWQDFVHLEGGNAGPWWDQIREQLEHASTEHMLLFVSADALASTVVIDEWRLARSKGVEVHLVKVPNKLSGDAIRQMPAGLSQAQYDDLTISERFDRLIAALKGPSRQLKVPMMAPVHDEHFVLRQEESDKLIASLLRAPEPDAEANSKNGRAVGITAALRGAGGYGKTQLARWLCQQERIVDNFYDGILWVELGENPDTTGGLQGKVEYLIKALRREITDEDRGFPNATAAAKRLFELLEKGGTKDKGRYLLMIDDAWRKSDVDLFMGGAPNTVRLVTTRLDDTLPIGADKIAVDAMKPAEAVELLAVGLDRLGVAKAGIDASRAALTHLAGRLGEWALLLTLANGQLRSEIEVGSSLPEALLFVERIYDEMGLTAFDPKDETQRSRVAALSIGASFRHLTSAEVARFEDLAIFPEDEHIPVATIARLWATTGGLDDLASQQLLRKLKKYALLMSLDLASGTARLHDVMRKYLRDRVGKEGLVERHKAWLAVYGGLEGKSIAGPEQLYYYRRRPLHLAEAGERAALDALLTNVEWMQEKLAALGSPLLLIDDYRAYAPYDPANKTAAALVGRALTQSAGALGREKRQLIPHLLGRLRADLAPGIGDFIAKARRALRPPALVSNHPILAPANSGLLRTLEGHLDEVRAVAFSPDGMRVVSGSDDTTIRLWNLTSGTENLKPLAGHSRAVSAVTFSPDGTRVISGSWDKTIRLWDAADGVAIGKPIDNHLGEVCAVAICPKGKRIASGSSDHTLRLWDAASGTEIGEASLGSEVAAVAFSPDGKRAVAGTANGFLWLCDVESGSCRRIANHGGRGGMLSRRVNSVEFSPDGRIIASCSSAKTIRLWDATSGEAIRNPLEGHLGEVSAVAFSPDGRQIVSCSSDKSIRLWDVASGAAVGAPIVGHDDRVGMVAFSPDGSRIISASSDNTLRLWDAAGLATNEKLLEESSDTVDMGRFKPSGLFIIPHDFDENPLKPWAKQSGAVIGKALKGNHGFLETVASSPDGQHVASGSFDHIIRLHDTASGSEIARFEGEAGIATIAFGPAALAVGDRLGRIYVLDWITDETAKAAWIARCDENQRVPAVPCPPPADIGAAPPAMRVTAADLADARWVERFRGRHLFALSDGRVYIDGLIAVSSLDHARATLDYMASQSDDA